MHTERGWCPEGAGLVRGLPKGGRLEEEEHGAQALGFRAEGFRCSRVQCRIVFKTGVRRRHGCPASLLEGSFASRTTRK